MISRRTCAARGSCDWPSQKIAFLRSSLSCSVLAILISASNAAASWRCEYTKISWSFMSWFCIRSYSPALTGPEQRLLALLDRLALVHRDVHHPAHVLRAFHLRDREDHLLLQVV